MIVQDDKDGLSHNDIMSLCAEISYASNSKLKESFYKCICDFKNANISNDIGDASFLGSEEYTGRDIKKRKRRRRRNDS